MNKIFAFIPIVLFPFLLNSCINFKSDYPDINYYRLEQKSSMARNIETIEGSALIRGFTSASEYDTDQLLAITQKGDVQKYFYHRWTSHSSDIAQDFFIERFNNNKAFSKGALRLPTAVVPDYIIEGNILQMIAKNSDSDSRDSNLVKLSIQITVLKRDPMKADLRMTLQNVYSTESLRKNASAANIAEAFSEAFSLLADQVFLDLQKAISLEKINK